MKFLDYCHLLRQLLIFIIKLHHFNISAQKVRFPAPAQQCPHTADTQPYGFCAKATKKQHEHLLMKRSEQYAESKISVYLQRYETADRGRLTPGPGSVAFCKYPCRFLRLFTKHSPQGYSGSGRGRICAVPARSRCPGHLSAGHTDGFLNGRD